MNNGATQDPGLSVVQCDTFCRSSGSRSTGMSQFVPRHASCGAQNLGIEWTKSDLCFDTDHWVKNWTLEKMLLRRGRV